MKTNLKKGISFILVLCFVLSTFTVFASATNDKKSSSLSTLIDKKTEHYIVDQVGADKSGNFRYEQNVISGVNPFHYTNVHVDAGKVTTGKNSSGNQLGAPFVNIGTSGNFSASEVKDTGFYTVDFDICTTSKYLPITRQWLDITTKNTGYTNGRWRDDARFSISADGVVSGNIDGQNHTYNMGTDSGVWHHISVIYDFANNKRVSFVDGNLIERTKWFTPRVSGETVNDITKIDNMRWEFPTNNTSIDQNGGTTCFANMESRIYTKNSNFSDILNVNQSTNIKAVIKKEHNLIYGSDYPTYTPEGPKSELIMKIGVGRALKNDQKVAINTPVKSGSEILVPLEEICTLTATAVSPLSNGYRLTRNGRVVELTFGSQTCKINGQTVALTSPMAKVGNKYGVINYKDVEKIFDSYYSSYDEMGLVSVSKSKLGYTRETLSLDELMNIMKKFVFDFKTPDEIYSIAGSNTNNFKNHPYLFADQARFDEIKKIYDSKDENSETYQKLAYIVKDADRSLQNYALDDGSLNPSKKPINKNYGKYANDGYDIGGRLSVPTGILMNLAFAYQLTRDYRYARLAYDWIIALGEWKHWGQGHFLNCADASAPVAITIDWIWPAIQSLGGGRTPTKVIDVLYTHGVHMGYLSSTGKPDPFPRAKGNAFFYTTRTNNWNAVCSSGMIIASLVVMGDNAKPEYKSESTYIVSNNFKTLIQYGLGQYAPDGSYIESAGYWAYGTNTLIRLICAMRSAMGTDLGLLDCWGLDKTCYFACNVEDNNLHAWAYHDGGSSAVDTSWFIPMGHFLNDETLISIRRNQVKNGKPLSFWDIIYDDGRIVTDKDLPLQYKMEGIDGYSVRASWERDAMFAGLMGGSNACPHGQIDVGAFVYHNNGKIWITDLGGDNYNVPDYWGYNGYHYYKKNAEGNNTLCLTSSPTTQDFGQLKNNATGTITKTFDNNFGAFVVMDNTSAFGSDIANYWRRGMLTTNNRKTVIIQDEVSFKGLETLYWFAHMNIFSTVASVDISKDGKTAYLTSYADSNGKAKTLRLSILSDNLDLKFEVMDTYTFVLGGTYSPSHSNREGYAPEHSRNQYNKLAIKIENVKDLLLAVAIEDVTNDGTKPEPELGYALTNMDKWMPHDDTRSDTGTGETHKVTWINNNGEKTVNDIKDRFSPSAPYETLSINGETVHIAWSDTPNGEIISKFPAITKDTTFYAITSIDHTVAKVDINGKVDRYIGTEKSVFLNDIVKDNAKVTLYSNITFNKNLPARNITIDLNSHKLTLLERFDLKVNCSLTIKNGQIENKGREIVYVDASSRNSTFLIDNCDILANSRIIDARQGNITVRNSKIDQRCNHLVETMYRSSGVVVNFENDTVTVNERAESIFFTTRATGEKTFSETVNLKNFKVSGSIPHIFQIFGNKANCPGLENSKVTLNADGKCEFDKITDRFVFIDSTTGFNNQNITLNFALGTKFGSHPELNADKLSTVFNYGNGNSLVQSGENYIVSIKNQGLKVTDKDGKETIYGESTTLESVLGSVQDGATVTLLKDYTVSTTVRLRKNITIDLNNFKLTLSNCRFEVLGASSYLNFKRGEFIATSGQNILYCNEAQSKNLNILFENCTFTGLDHFIDVRAGNTVLRSCKINASSSARTLLSGGYRGSGFKFTLDGVVINSTNTEKKIYSLFNQSRAVEEAGSIDTSYIFRDVTVNGTVRFLMDAQNTTAGAKNSHINISIEGNSKLNGVEFNVQNGINCNVNVGNGVTFTSLLPKTKTVNLTLGNGRSALLANSDGTFTVVSKLLKGDIYLNLDTDINLIFVSDKSGFVTFELDGVLYTVEGVLKNGKYEYRFENIDPRYMTDIITVSQNGVAVSTVSIQNYCKELLSKYSADDILKSLVYDILHYGASAQIYTDYRIDNLADIGIPRSSTVLTLNNVKTLTSIGSCTFTRVSIKLEGAIKMCFEFHKNTSASLELRVSINGREKVFTEKDFVLQQNGNYLVTYGDIMANEFADIVTVTVGGATAVTYSVNSYLDDVKNSDLSEEISVKLKNLADSIAKYGQSVTNYKNTH